MTETEKRSYITTPGQRAMYAIQQADPTSSANNIGFAVRVLTGLQIDLLRKSLNELIRRHPILRTVYEEIDGVLYQRILDDTECALFIRDAENWSAEYLRKEFQKSFYMPFDLANGPVFRMHAFMERSGSVVLLMALHHIAADGWSVWLLLEELFALMTGDIGDKEPDFSYFHHAEKESGFYTSDEGKAQLAYWRDVLSAPLPTLDLPMDGKRSDASEGDVFPFAFSVEKTREIKAFARQQGVSSTFSFLLAVYWILLRRYTRETDILIGCPMAARLNRATRRTIGYFVNLVSFRGDLRNNPTFVEHLLNSAGLLNSVRKNQRYPFSEIVRSLSLSADTSSTSLCRAALVMQRSRPQWTPVLGGALDYAEHGAKIQIGPYELESYPLVQQAGAEFDLILEYGEIGNVLKTRFKYAKGMFSRDTIARMATHFKELVESILRDPSTPIDDLNMVPESELAVFRRRKLKGRSAVRRWESGTIHDRFAEMAKAHPHSVAVVDADKKLDYAELNEKANQLAHHLIVSHKVKQGQNVAIFLDRGSATIIAMLAVLKAGATYVPIDVSYPTERVAHIVSDSRCSTIITESSQLCDAPESSASLVFMDSIQEILSGCLKTDPEVPSSPEDGAYIIYTSGSTGRPKGVEISHKNMARLFTSTCHWFEFTKDDVWTWFHSHAFDFSVWEIFGALLWGGRVVVVSRDTVRSPKRFLEMLIDEGVTVLNQTPSAFYRLTEEAVRQNHPATALRYIVFGGEALNFMNLNPWAEAYGVESPRLVNMYGITETTVHVTYRRIGVEDIEKGSKSLIGIPIPDLSVYICDERGRLSPLGIPGEIWVGGDGVAKGYLNRETLTREKFVEADLLGEGKERLYRSGDLGRWLPSGELEYLGRIDQQVKIRGFRIELGEIEGALARLPEVRACVVLAVNYGEDDCRLVAFCVPKNDTFHNDSVEWRAALGKQLPSYMIPSALVLVDEIPMTAHGKVDRRELEKVLKRRIIDKGHPLNRERTLEEKIEKVWQRKLALPNVDPNASFFDIGGDSLLSVAIVNEINSLTELKQAKTELSIASFYQNPTLHQIVEQVIDLVKQFRSIENPSPISSAVSSGVENEKSSNREVMRRRRIAARRE